MRKNFWTALALNIFFAASIFGPAAGLDGSAGAQPQTRIEDAREIIHGAEVRDPYRWLEGDSDEVASWMRAQNAYTRSILDKIPQRESIRKRLQELYGMGSVSVPVARGSRYFFRERKGQEEHPILYVQDGLSGHPRVLIDPAMLSRDKKTMLGGWTPSRDGRLLAYGLSDTGGDARALKIMEVDTLQELADTIPAAVFPYFDTWTPDGSGFWYMRRPIQVPQGEEKYHKKIYFHLLGTNWENDELVCCSGMGKEDWPRVEISQDGRWLLFQVLVLSRGVGRTEIYLQDRNRTSDQPAFLAVVKGVDEEFSATMHRGVVYFSTNHLAPLGKLMAVDLKDAAQGMSAWRTIIPEGKSKIGGFHTVQDKIFVEFLENVSSTWRLYTPEGGFLGDIPLPMRGSLSYVSSEKEAGELFFGFSSFFWPHAVYRYDLALNKYTLFKKVEAGINPASFEIKQVWYPSKDGTKIPTYVMHKKGMLLDGQNPAMLYAYGGFGISATPYFDREIVMFLERGGVYAIANIRGGGEFGKEWHEAARREKRQNGFDDFISAAEWLIAEKYTNPSRLAIWGWSNGGLLTAMVLIQRPELFGAVVIGAPITDMVRFHKFVGGRTWMNEYGDPDNPQDFRHLLAYSPYHNVKDKTPYPAVLILIAESDDRVHPLHSYKMAARLQMANSSQSPILLRVEEKGGHGGAAGVSGALDLYGDMWSFIFQQLGVK